MDTETANGSGEIHYNYAYVFVYALIYSDNMNGIQ